VDVIAESAAFLKHESLGELEWGFSVSVYVQCTVYKNEDALINRGLAVDLRRIAIEGEVRKPTLFSHDLFSPHELLTFVGQTRNVAIETSHVVSVCRQRRVIVGDELVSDFFERHLFQ